MTQLEVVVGVEEDVEEDKRQRQRIQFDKIIDAYKQDANFVFEDQLDNTRYDEDCYVFIYDKKAGILSNKTKKINETASVDALSAVEIESAILNADDSIDPKLDSNEAASYCTHCRADLRDYPNPTYCPECGKRPKPP